MAAIVKKTAEKGSYEDLRSSFEWGQDGSSHTLVVKVPGFRKQHLKATYFPKSGKIQIKGERQFDGDRWDQFVEVQVPDKCNTDQIQAYLWNGILKIVFLNSNIAKEPSLTADKQKQIAAEGMGTSGGRGKLRDMLSSSDSYHEDKARSANIEIEEKKGKYISFVGNRRTLIMANLVMTTILLVGFGLFAAYKFRNGEIIPSRQMVCKIVGKTSNL